VNWREEDGVAAEKPCAVAASLKVLGDRWTLLILRDAFSGTRRFEAFRENLGIARNILSGRLRSLVEAGIFERHLYQSHPDRYEYRLTEKGRDLHTLILSLRAWGKRWITHEASTLIHQGCGHVVEPTMICPECSEAIAPNDLSRELAPTAIQ
jgi:DNA-binding HxlR family transcriptional regulator